MDAVFVACCWAPVWRFGLREELGSGSEPSDPISLELRLVYTIDEIPFAGRELAEPTWATIARRELRWRALPRCLP